MYTRNVSLKLKANPFSASELPIFLIGTSFLCSANKRDFTKRSLRRRRTQ